MFICPTCGREFIAESQVVKHFLACWKELNPNHQSKDAPRSADIETRAPDSDAQEFFALLKKGGK